MILKILIHLLSVLVRVLQKSKSKRMNYLKEVHLIGLNDSVWVA